MDIMTDLDIETAFEVTLQAVAEQLDIDVAYPAIPYKPQQSKPFIRPSIVPGRQSSVGIGTHSRNRHIGFYQLNLVVPSLETKGPLTTIVTALKNVFKRGTVLELGELKVRVTRFRIDGYFEAEDWTTQFIRIEYRADLEN